MLNRHDLGLIDRVAAPAGWMVGHQRAHQLKLLAAIIRAPEKAVHRLPVADGRHDLGRLVAQVAH